MLNINYSQKVQKQNNPSFGMAFKKPENEAILLLDKIQDRFTLDEIKRVRRFMDVIKREQDGYKHFDMIFDNSVTHEKKPLLGLAILPKILAGDIKGSWHSGIVCDETLTASKFMEFLAEKANLARHREASYNSNQFATPYSLNIWR